MFLLLIAAQTATPASVPPSAQSWSILAPVPNQPCVPRGTEQQGAEGQAGDIIVCGQPLPSQTLPYPDQVISKGPAPSNPYRTGSGALAVSSTPCAAQSGGCTGGLDLFGGGTTVVRLLQKAIAPDSCCEETGEGNNPVLLVKDAVSGVKRLFAGKPDKSGRVPISLDDAPPPSVILP